MLRYIKLLFVISFLFIGCLAQERPLNKDYLKIEWQNPEQSADIDFYRAYRFPTVEDTLTVIDSAETVYMVDNSYGLYFDDLPMNDTVYFRIKSFNDYATSPYSGVTKGLLDDTFVPVSYELADTIIELRWETRFPGEVTHSWLKLVYENPDSLLSTDPKYYVDLGINSNSEIVAELQGIRPNKWYYFFAFEVCDAQGMTISGDLQRFRINKVPATVIIIQTVK